MTTLSLSHSEIASLVYGNLVAMSKGFGISKPAVLLERMQSVLVMMEKCARTAELKRRAAEGTAEEKFAEIDLSFDDLHVLILERLLDVRRSYLTDGPAVAYLKFSRIIELQRVFVKASRDASLGRAA